jgi:hypothetical protein
MTDYATKLEQVLKRYGGELYGGRHKAVDGECCILELVSVCKGLEWTDDPRAVGMPDYRTINDGNWSTPKLRGTHMLRLAVAFEAWPEWPEERRRRFAERLVVRTVNVLIAELPHIGEDAARACRAADTLTAAEAAAADAAEAYAEAAYAYAAAAAWDAADAAEDAAAWATATAATAAAAALAAEAAARSAAAAEDPDKVLIQAVDIWVEAAEWSNQ